MAVQWQPKKFFEAYSNDTTVIEADASEGVDDAPVRHNHCHRRPRGTRYSIIPTTTELGLCNCFLGQPCLESGESLLENFDGLARTAIPPQRSPLRPLALVPPAAASRRLLSALLLLVVVVRQPHPSRCFCQVPLEVEARAGEVRGELWRTAADVG